MQMTEILRKTPDGFKPASQLNDGPEWFADIRRRMRASASGLVSEVVILSPSRAQALLEANEHNRNVSDRAVTLYAQDIAEGRWTFNGEPVIISDTGELNDGQHRCAAVMEAGRAIEVMLIAGVPRAARTTTDMGRARTPGDFIHMHGITDANKVAAVANILMSYERGLLATSSSGGEHSATSRRYGTKAAVLSYARANLVDIKRAISAVDAKKAAILSTGSRFAGMLAIIARASGDWAAAEAYIRSIVEGEGLAHGSAALAVRDKLLADRQQKTLSPGKSFEIILRGWNAHRLRLKVSRLRLVGAIPEIEV